MKRNFKYIVIADGRQIANPLGGVLIGITSAEAREIGRGIWIGAHLTHNAPTVEVYDLNNGILAYEFK